MKAGIQAQATKEVANVIKISPTGQRLIILTLILQLPFCWMPFVTQIMTCILLAVALTQIKRE